MWASQKLSGHRVISLKNETVLGTLGRTTALSMLYSVEGRKNVSYFHMSSQSYEELSSKIKDSLGLEIFRCVCGNVAS
jgi:hypothetical protein